MGWQDAGAAWSSRAWDWAMYQEPGHANSYDVLQGLTGVGPGTHLLDVACGSGLALQRAAARGARVSGVDAAAALLDIAGQRAPAADLRQADIAELPFDDATFDVVTGTNALQYSGVPALLEAVRVLKPGGRIGLAFWADHRDFAEHFAIINRLSPPKPPAPPGPSMTNAADVAWLLGDAGLEVLETGTHEMVGLYRNVDDAATGMAASGPAIAAINHSGAEAYGSAMADFLRSNADPATGRVRLVATCAHVVARKPS